MIPQYSTIFRRNAAFSGTFEYFKKLLKTKNGKLLQAEKESDFFLLKLKMVFCILFHNSCKNFPIMTYTVRKARNCKIE